MKSPTHRGHRHGRISSPLMSKQIQHISASCIRQFVSHNPRPSGQKVNGNNRSHTITITTLNSITHVLCTTQCRHSPSPHGSSLSCHVSTLKEPKFVGQVSNHPSPHKAEVPLWVSSTTDSSYSTHPRVYIPHSTQKSLNNSIRTSLLQQLSEASSRTSSPCVAARPTDLQHKCPPSSSITCPPLFLSLLNIHNRKIFLF